MRSTLTEIGLGLEAIHKASAREKSIRHGHPPTLHLWWLPLPLQREPELRCLERDLRLRRIARASGCARMKGVLDDEFILTAPDSVRDTPTMEVWTRCP